MHPLERPPLPTHGVLDVGLLRRRARTYARSTPAVRAALAEREAAHHQTMRALFDPAMMRAYWLHQEDPG